MTSAQFELLRDGENLVTVKAEITDSVDGTIYDDEIDIHLIVVNDGKDGKDGKDSKKFDFDISRNHFYADPNNHVNSSWPANTPISLNVSIDNIIPNPHIEWEVKGYGGTYQNVSPIDMLLNFVSPDPYLVTEITVDQFNSIRVAADSIMVRASTVDQDGVYHSKEKEISLVPVGKAAKTFGLQADGETFTMDSDGVVSSTNPSNSTITFRVFRQGIVGTPDDVVWYVGKNGAGTVQVTGLDQLTVEPIDSNVATMTAEQFNFIRQEQESINVTATIMDTSVTPNFPYYESKKVRLIKEIKGKDGKDGNDSDPPTREVLLKANPLRFFRGSDGTISVSDPRNIDVQFEHTLFNFDYSKVHSVEWSYRKSDQSSFTSITDDSVITRINSTEPTLFSKALEATMSTAQFAAVVVGDRVSIIVKAIVTDDEGNTYTNRVTIDQIVETKGEDGKDGKDPDPLTRETILKANPLRFFRGSDGVISVSDPRNITVQFEHALFNFDYSNVQSVSWSYCRSDQSSFTSVTDNSIITRINPTDSALIGKALEATMSTAQFAAAVGSTITSIIVRTIVTDNDGKTYENFVTVDQTVETKGEPGKDAEPVREAFLKANPTRFIRNSDGVISFSDLRNVTVQLEHSLKNFDYSNVQSVAWSFRRADLENAWNSATSPYITLINTDEPGVSSKALRASISAAQFTNFVGLNNYSMVVRAVITDDNAQTYTDTVTIDLIVETKGKEAREVDLKLNPDVFTRDSNGNISSSDGRNINVLLWHDLENLTYANISSVVWKYRRSDAAAFTTVVNDTYLTRRNNVDFNLDKALEATMSAAQFASIVGSGDYSVVVQTVVTDTNNEQYTNEATIRLVKDGKDGDVITAPIKSLQLRADSNQFKKLVNSLYAPDIINFTLERNNLTGTASWTINGVASNVSLITLAADSNSATMSPEQFAHAGGDSDNPVRVSVLLDGLTDSETVFLIEDGKTVIEPAKDLRLDASHLYFRTNSNGNTSPSHIEFTATKVAISSILVWKVNDAVADATVLELQNETNTKMSLAQFVAAGGTSSNFVKVSVEADGLVRFVNIGLMVDAATPEVAKNFILTASPDEFYADHQGNVSTTDGRNISPRKLKIRKTGINLSSVEWYVKPGNSTTYQPAGSNIAVNNQLLASMNAAQFNTVRSSQEYIDVKAVGYEGSVTFEDEVTITILKDGPPPPPKLLNLTVDTTFITKKLDGTFEPSSFNFKVQSQGVIDTNISWYVNDVLVDNDDKITVLSDNLTATMSPSQYQYRNASLSTVRVKVRSDVDGLEDTLTVTIVVEKPIIRNFDMTVSRNTFTADSNDFVDSLAPSNSTINFQVIRDGFESTTPVVWQLEVGGVFENITTQYTYPLSSPFLNANMSAEQFNAIRGSNEIVRIKAYSIEGGTTYERIAEISLINMPSKEIERNYGDISLIASRYIFHKGIRNYDPSSAIQFEVIRGDGVSPFPFVQWKVKKASDSSYTDVSVSDATNLTVPNNLTTNPGYNLSSMSTPQFDVLRANESSVFVRADLVVPNTNTYEPNVNFYSSNSAEIYRGSGNLVAWLRPRSGNKPLNSVMSSNSVYVNQLYYAKPQTRAQNLTVNSYDYHALALENGNAIVAHSDIFNFTDAVSDKPFSISFLLKTPSTSANFGNSVILVKNKENSSLYDSSNNYQYAIYTQNSVYNNLFRFVFKFIGQNSTDSLTFTSSELSPFTINGLYYITFSFSPSESNANKLKIYYNGFSILTSYVQAGTWSKMYYNASSPSFINIGSNGDSYTQAMAGGLISEILIHNRNLSISEHRSLHNAVFTNSCNEYYTRNVEITRTVDRKLEMDPAQATFVKNQFNRYYPELQFKSFSLFKYNIDEPIVWTVNGSSADISSKITITTSTTSDLIEVNQSQFENNKDSSDKMVIKATAHGETASATLNLLNQNFKIPPQLIFQVAAGYDHCLALTTNGEVFAWGSNKFGQLGIAQNQNSDIPVLQPQIINLGSTAPKFVNISAGQYFSAAVDKDGNLWTWGSHSNYRTGRAISIGFSSVPTLISTTYEYSSTSGANTETGIKFKKVSCGPDYAIAIDTNGKLYCWGSNKYGKCGVTAYNSFDIEVNATIARPRRIQSSSDTRTFFSISAGSWHAIAHSYDNKAYSWGSNENTRTGIITDADYYEKTNFNGTNIVYPKIGHPLYENKYYRFTYNGNTVNADYENHVLKEIKVFKGEDKTPQPLNGIIDVSAGYKHGLLVNLEPNGEIALYGFGNGMNREFGNIIQYNSVPTLRIDKEIMPSSPDYLGPIFVGYTKADVSFDNLDSRYLELDGTKRVFAGHGMTLVSDGLYGESYPKSVGHKSEFYDNSNTTNSLKMFFAPIKIADDYFQTWDRGYFSFLAGVTSVSNSKGLDDSYHPYTVISKNGNFLWSFGYNHKGAAGHSDLVDNYVVGAKRVTILDEYLGIENEDDARIKLAEFFR